MQKSKTDLTIIHIFGGVIGSGEERVLQTIAENSRDGFHHIIIDLCRSGRESPLLAQAKDRIVLPLYFGSDSKKISASVEKLKDAVLSKKPDVLQGWAAPGNAYALYMKEMLNSAIEPSVVLRLSNPRKIVDMPEDEKPLVSHMLENIQSGKTLPDAVFSVSEETARSYREMGINTPLIDIIFNGVDTKKFKPDNAQQSIRREQRVLYGIPDNCRMIGLVARFDMQKGVDVFVKAAALLHASPEYQDIHFLLRTESDPKLLKWIHDAGLDSVVHILGPQEDMSPIYHLADIWTNSSRSEAFSNAMLEALACGKPTVMTNTDMAPILSPALAELVPIEAPEAMADAWKKILALEPNELRKRCDVATRFVEEKFSLNQAVKAYENLYASFREQTRYVGR